MQPSVPEYKEPEPPPPPPPPAPEFLDLTVPSDAVLGLQIERTVSSELARVEDKVDARVTRDVRVVGSRRDSRRLDRARLGDRSRQAAAA